MSPNDNKESYESLNRGQQNIFDEIIEDAQKQKPIKESKRCNTYGIYSFYKEEQELETPISTQIREMYMIAGEY